jgi:glyoxylase-like metal-dependent hydrolase (beta-lactamase superfamily II)
MTAATEVAAGVRHIANPLVNWYLIEGEDGMTAVDAGFPPDWDRLKRELDGAPLKAVLITHGHVDHVGFAERARRELGATIYISERDAKIARSPIPLAKSERNPLLYFLREPQTRKLYLGALMQRAALGQRIKEFTTFADGDVLDVPGRPRVIECPGHTFGHCAIHLADRDVLFTGDALVTFDPYTARTGPCLVARAATADSTLNLQSLDRLERTAAKTILVGHGDPYRGGIEEAVAKARAAGAA